MLGIGKLAQLVLDCFALQLDIVQVMWSTIWLYEAFNWVVLLRDESFIRSVHTRACLGLLRTGLYRNHFPTLAKEYLLVTIWGTPTEAGFLSLDYRI